MINLFSETLRATTNSITSNKALIQKIYFPASCSRWRRPSARSSTTCRRRSSSW
ncbi:hypothetical protein [Leucobacter soli]|uniref:hypothetical protein n=1 Tax=Leucobacter soli TaxID=2812850 RepID=UPI0036065C5A